MAGPELCPAAGCVRVPEPGAVALAQQWWFAGANTTESGSGTGTPQLRGHIPRPGHQHPRPGFRVWGGLLDVQFRLFSLGMFRIRAGGEEGHSRTGPHPGSSGIFPAPWSETQMPNPGTHRHDSVAICDSSFRSSVQQPEFIKGFVLFGWAIRQTFADGLHL